MYQLLRGPYTTVSSAQSPSRDIIQSYNLPKASVSLVSGLVGALALGHRVSGVDEATKDVSVVSLVGPALAPVAH